MIYTFARDRAIPSEIARGENPPNPQWIMPRRNARKTVVVDLYVRSGSSDSFGDRWGENPPNPQWIMPRRNARKTVVVDFCLTFATVE